MSHLPQGHATSIRPSKSGDSNRMMGRSQAGFPTYGKGFRCTYRPPKRFGRSTVFLPRRCHRVLSTPCGALTI